MTQFCVNTMNRSPFMGVEDADLLGQIAGAAAAGFRWFGPDVFSLDAWRSDGRTLEELVGALQDAGMGCFELPGFMVSADEEATLEQARRIAEAAAVLRPRWIPIGVDGPAGDEVVANYVRCADVLEEVGARIALEFLPYTRVRSIDDARDLVEAVGRERTGIILDTWHFFRGPDDWEALEALPLAFVAYVQFDDALPLESDDLVSETIHRRALPGEGEFDLMGFCSRLVTKGFDGVVSVEILSLALRELPPAEYARRVFDASQRYWPEGS